MFKNCPIPCVASLNGKTPQKGQDNYLESDGQDVSTPELRNHLLVNPMILISKMKIWEDLMITKILISAQMRKKRKKKRKVTLHLEVTH